MNFNNAVFESAFGTAAQLPPSDLPEVCFAGRSNVGKSSLINRVLGRKAIARVSSRPGKTVTVNFYRLDGLRLVDLPGYGYAKVAESEKQKWGRMIENYLHTSKQLKAVFLLIDIRHTPGTNDKTMYDWIVYQGYQPIIIATKLDKLKRSQVQKALKEVRVGLGLKTDDVVIPFSAQTKQGRDEIWALMDELIGAET